MPYTPLPVTLATISLYPPAVPSLALVTSTFHPLRSQNFAYIRNRSPANRQASSPPVPPRISSITFLLSSGSAGTSNNFNSCSIPGNLSSSSSISISAISRSSLSSSCSRISFDSSTLSRAALNLSAVRVIVSNSLYSLVNLT